MRIPRIGLPFHRPLAHPYALYRDFESKNLINFRKHNRQIRRFAVIELPVCCPTLPLYRAIPRQIARYQSLL